MVVCCLTAESLVGSAVSFVFEVDEELETDVVAMVMLDPGVSTDVVPSEDSPDPNAVVNAFAPSVVAAPVEDEGKRFVVSGAS